MWQYNRYSVWAPEPERRQPALEGEQSAEVAVIGGGYTGLMAAITLADRGVDVALLERSFCGFGASGTNAGHLTPTIGRDLAFCLKAFGVEKGVALARFAEDAVAFTEDVFSELGIECDYEATGNIIAGVHESQRGALERAAASVGAAGIRMTFLDGDAMRERGLPRAFRFGIREGCGGLLNPGRYVMALRRVAIERGVRIHEDSPVEGMEMGRPLRLRTPGGALTADRALVATNAFTAPCLGHLRTSVAPLRVTLFDTRPLTDDEMAAVGWPGRQGIYTAHQALENYRLTADNRLSGGSKWVSYGYGSRLTDGHQPELFEDFEKLLAARFPELPDLEIENFWGGWIGLTLDMLPICGVDPRHDNLYRSVGYNGHGIAQATRMGHVMAHEMLGEPQPELELFRGRRFRMPPEPLRWAGLRVVSGVMGLLDRRVDRAVAAEARGG